MAHWLLEPFFKHNVHGGLPHPVKYEDLPNKGYLFVIGEVDVSKSPKQINVDVEGTLIRPHQGFKNERIDNIGIDKIQVANFAVDNEFVLASIPTFLAGFGFLILTFYTFLRKRDEKINFAQEEVKKLKETDCQIEDVEKVPTFVLIFLSFVLLVFFSAVSWLQISIGKYLFGVSFHQLEFTAGHAKIVSLVYWGSLVLGTFLGIFVIKVLQAKTLTSILIALLALTLLPWYFVARCHGLLWLVATLLGLSTSAMFATAVSWAFENFRLSGTIGAVISVARTAGLMLGPTTIVVVLKHFGLQSFLPITASITSALTLLFILMHFTANKYGLNRVRKLTVDANPKPLDRKDEEQTGGWLHQASIGK